MFRCNEDLRAACREGDDLSWLREARVETFATVDVKVGGNPARSQSDASEGLQLQSGFFTGTDLDERLDSFVFRAANGDDPILAWREARSLRVDRAIRQVYERCLESARCFVVADLEAEQIVSE